MSKEEIFYSLYFLIDPFTMEVFYVGIAEDPVQRYIQHISLDENERKNERIQEIIHRGSLPLLHIFFMRVQRKANMMIYEAAWTEVLLHHKQPLTNRTMKVYKHDTAFYNLLSVITAVVETMGLKEGRPFVLPDNERIVESATDMLMHDTAFQAILREHGYSVMQNGSPVWPIEDDL